CEGPRVSRVDPPRWPARAAGRGRLTDACVEAHLSAVSGGVLVRELKEGDLPSAVGVVARGMRDNPLHIAALGDDMEIRGQRLIRMFTVALPLILSKAVVLGAFDGETLAGIAGMTAPGQCQPSLTERV